MCGRYDNLIAREAYRALYKALRLPESNFPPRYNIAPTDQIPIVRVDPRDGMRELTMARWGLIPFWMKEKPKVPHINARAETVHKTPLFREAFAKRRALVPATGFYEWQKRADGRQPYRFVRNDLEPFAFAGLWEFTRLEEARSAEGGTGTKEEEARSAEGATGSEKRSEEILSATIIVGDPNPLVGAIHDRMPVILMPKDYDRWLDGGTSIDEARAMLRPYDEALMRAYAVSRAVNSVKNDSEDLIEPIADEDAPKLS
jgi:putative SOS response-associated peptidase YedK